MQLLIPFCYVVTVRHACTLHFSQLYSPSNALHPALPSMLQKTADFHVHLPEIGTVLSVTSMDADFDDKLVTQVEQMQGDLDHMLAMDTQDSLTLASGIARTSSAVPVFK